MTRRLLRLVVIEGRKQEMPYGFKSKGMKGETSGEMNIERQIRILENEKKRIEGYLAEEGKNLYVHDINNILASLYGSTQMMLDYPTNCPENYREKLEVVDFLLKQIHLIAESYKM